MSFFAALFFICKHLLILLFLVLSSCGFGAAIEALFRHNKTSEARIDSGCQTLFYQFCMGLAVWSYAVFTLGCLHLIYKAALISMFVLSMFLFFRYGRFNLEVFTSAKRLNWELSSLLLLLVIVVVPVFVASLYPAVSWDDTMYHLPVARAFLQSHWLIPTPYLRYVVFNDFTNLIFLPLLAVGGDTAAQQLSVASFLFCGIGIYALLEKTCSRTAGLLGVLAWSTSELFALCGNRAVIDINLAVMGLAGVCAGIDVFNSHSADNQKRNIIRAGIFLGCAIASKLLAALLLASFLSSANLLNVIVRKFEFSKFKIDFKASIIIGIIAVLVVSPWLIRSCLVTGNPVWPFADRIFGPGTYWSTFDYNSQAESLAATKGIARSVWNFIKLPWLLSFKNTQIAEMTYTPCLFFAVYFALPFLFFRRDKTIKLLFCTIVGYLLLWFVSTQQVRYAMAIAPVVCALFGAVSARYLQAFVRKDRKRQFVAWLLIAPILIFGYEREAYANMIDNFAMLPYDNSRRDKYLASRSPMFETFRGLAVLPDGRTYGLLLTNMLYHSNKEFLGDFFGPARYEDFRRHRKSGDDLYGYLKSMDIKYLVVNTKNILYFELPTDKSFDAHFKRVFTDGTGEIYVLAP